MGIFDNILSKLGIGENESPESRLETNKVARCMNLLEILAGQRVPDGVLTVFLTFLSALTLAPYLGGRSLWILGGSPVTIPTLSETLFWVVIFATPFLWMLALGRIFHAPKSKVATNIFSASLVTAGLVAMHSFYPTLGLTAIDSSYLEEHELSAWYITAAHLQSDYRYFRSDPIILDVHKGCALRIERIEISSGGWAKIENTTSAFDFQVFASTSSLLPPTFKSQQNHRNSSTIEGSKANMLREEPINAEVKGRAVVRVKKDDLLNSDGHIDVSVLYDFTSRAAKVTPGEYAKKKLEQADLVVREASARLQLVVWTLYGDQVELTINDPIIRISGKEHCSITSWL